MALQIALPRALDALGDIIPLATAYFFEAGSTAPLVVYEDKNLNTSRGTTVNADANGVFPQCWVDNSKAVKVDIQDGDALSLPGYPQDNHGTYPDSQGAAASLSFAPYSPNANTNVQTAIEANVDRINVVENSTRIAVATGSGGSYAITSGNTIPSYAVGQEFEFIANHASVGGGGDTLNVDAVGGSIIKKYDGALAKVDLAASEINAGDPVRVKYDGTNLIWMGNPVTAASFAASTLVTEAEGIAANNNDTTIPTSAAVNDAIADGEWALHETIYNNGGSVTSIETSDFEDGYQYEIRLIALEMDTATDGTDLEVQGLTAGSYSSPVQFMGGAAANGFRYGRIRFETARKTLGMHLIGIAGGRSSLAAGDAFFLSPQSDVSMVLGFTTAQKIQKARLGGTMTTGVVEVWRRAAPN